MPSDGAYTMRAQPRRRKDGKDEPIFLRKTYEMITSCGEKYASWSPAGDTFVIKDPDTFANEIIPRFFKRESLVPSKQRHCAANKMTELYRVSPYVCCLRQVGPRLTHPLPSGG